MSLNVDRLPVAVFSVGEGKMIGSWNREMEILTGIPRSKAIGSSYKILRFHATDFDDEPLDLFKCLDTSKSGDGKRNIFLALSSGIRKQLYVQIRITANPFLLVMTLSDIAFSTLCTMMEPVSSGITFFHGLVGKDERMIQLYARIRKASEVNSNILITGESGTGKELVARAIHDLSERKAGPFLAVHCAALSETLLESELFGHVKGSFTGAVRDYAGKFETAQGGTIFLDEIGEVSPLIQVKLLRVIQERKIQRVGSSKEMPVDIRIIVATNRNLRELVKIGEFREDLFFRLHVFPLETPSLREHKNDIPLMVDYFLRKLGAKMRKDVKSVSVSALRHLMDYPFPGNVRELENAIEHGLVLATGSELGDEDLPSEIRLYSPMEKDLPVSGKYSEIQPVASKKKRNILTKEKIVETLETVNGNRTETARLLGISRVALWHKMRKMGIG